MVALFQLTLPIIVMISFVAFKLNHKQKGIFFKIPVLISATAMSLLIGHLAPGVMGFYGAAFCDLLLFPALLLVKKLWSKKETKLNPQLAIA